jgi:hypothetical protein
LIVKHQLGWANAAWTYYELDNGKLQKKLSIDVTYAESENPRYPQVVKMEITTPKYDKLKNKTDWSALNID